MERILQRKIFPRDRQIELEANNLDQRAAESPEKVLIRGDKVE